MRKSSVLDQLFQALVDICHIGSTQTRSEIPTRCSLVVEVISFENVVERFLAGISGGQSVEDSRPGDIVAGRAGQTLFDQGVAGGPYGRSSTGTSRIVPLSFQVNRVVVCAGGHIGYLAEI